MTASPARNRTPVALNAFLALAATIIVAALVIHRGQTPSTHRLEISTEPPECQILLDGSFIGLSPVAVEDVAPGEHVVEAARYGHVSEVQRIVLTPAHRVEHLQLVLQRIAACRIEISSTPAGATIFLNGEERGITPMVVEGLPPGEHRLVLRRPRCDVWHTKLELEPGQTATVEARLADTFQRYLLGAIETDPSDMAARGMLFHYFATQEDWESAAGAFCQTLAAMVRSKSRGESGRNVWYWFYRDAELMRPCEEAFSKAFATHVARLAETDPEVAAAALRLLSGRSGETPRRREGDRASRKLRLFFLTARAAAGCPQVAEAALEEAARLDRPEELGPLLDAAAAARPDDAEYLTRLRSKLADLARRHTGTSFADAALAGASRLSVQPEVDTQQEERPPPEP